MRQFIVHLLVGLLVVPGLCFGWNREGHRMVAYIAQRQLNSHARDEVAKLLDPGESLESIASWADDIRPQRRETGPWHYINIPIQTSHGKWEQYCPSEGCVVRKINELVAYLKAGTGTRLERAEALKFLVHFIGDMHQPLHAGDNHDRGGNDVKAEYEKQPTNLHSIWDGTLVKALESQDADLASNPAKGLNWWKRWTMRSGSPSSWAWQSHDRARDVAYRNLPADRPAVISEAYVSAALPTVKQQLQRGGTRLAKTMNEIWR